MTNTADTDLMDDEAALKVIDRVAEEVRKSYDLQDSDEDIDEEEEGYGVRDSGAWVCHYHHAQVCPTNPPYNEPEYVAPFIHDLASMLKKCGFKPVGGHLDRKFVHAGARVEATIENVNDEDKSIVIDFYRAR